MIKIAEYRDDFFEIYSQKPGKIVAYGAGKELRKNFDRLPAIELICDRAAKEIVEYKGVKVVEPVYLQELKEPLYIIVCVWEHAVYTEICNDLRKYDIDAVVFHFFNNIAFGYSFLETGKSYYAVETSKRLTVNIVCRDNGWIFTKFANRLCENLEAHHVDVSISQDTKSNVDVNHHIPFANYQAYSNDTLMITHVNIEKTFLLLKRQLAVAGMGICMSKDTMETLTAYGLPRNKLCYINPGHDNVIRPQKYVIGIMHRCYDMLDVRKRATAILNVLEGVSPLYFKFVIMGSGWNEIVREIKRRGFEIQYYPEFVFDTYEILFQDMDYLLYMGFDEGSMGYLDAMAAGVGTIATPQGFHLDSGYPIDYPCSTIAQFREAFWDLQRKREKRVRAVADWTWEQYTWKHLEIWNYLLKRKSLKELYKHQSCYMDGIFSVLIEDDRV